MLVVEILLIAFGIVGHTAFWVSAVNRIHSLGIPRWAIDAMSIVCWVVMLSIPLMMASLSPAWQSIDKGFLGDRPLTWIYLVVCSLMALVALAIRIRHLRHGDHPAVLLSNHTTSICLVESLGRRPVSDWVSTLMTRLPLNEALQIRIQEKTLRVPRLHPKLDGLKIAHLSDLHMSGRIEKDYFKRVVQFTNEREPDLVAITGDLFDEQDCVDWGPQVLGMLEARCGVYFVFGNHDLRVDSRHARALLTESGLVDLGGRWKQQLIDGHPIILAGNELPWFSPAADMEHCPERESERAELRILLSHAPDQFLWGRRFDFDLMLAGHTHGGQIRFPFLGPVLAPSRHGTKYAAGVFDMDPMILHVSRGVSGLTPLRWNCPPELAILTLQSGPKEL